jgi:hypothetical protein
VPQPPKLEFSRLNTHNGATLTAVSALHALLRLLLVLDSVHWVHLGYCRATSCHCRKPQEEPTWPSTRASQLLQACCWALGVVVVGQGG